MGISVDPDWLSGQSSIDRHRRARNHRIHRYEQDQRDTEFFLETNTGSSISYMTAQGPTVYPGDYIEIASPEGHLQFQVSEIEYYSHPADMWMAQLYPLTA